MSASTATHSTGRVTSTTDSRFTFDVLRHDGPVLGDFYAPRCRTCQLLEPVLDDLAPTWSDRLRIVSIDIERHPSAAQRYQIQSIPTLMLFDHGIEQDRLINVVRRERIGDWLHDHLDENTSDPSAGRTKREPHGQHHP